MKVSGRTFLKGSAVAGLGAAISIKIFKPVALAQQKGAKAAAKEEWVPTTCWIGKQDCVILARRIKGRVGSKHERRVRWL